LSCSRKRENSSKKILLEVLLPLDGGGQTEVGASFCVKMGHFQAIIESEVVILNVFIGVLKGV